MRFFAMAAVCVCLGAQTPAPTEIKGMPPRASAAEYQAHAKVGDLTIGAEFTGHAIVSVQGTLTTEDFVVIETGIFGPAGAHTTLSIENFTLRVNGKKTPLASEPYGRVIGNIKDPEWEPPKPPKSKTSIGGSGQEEKADPNAPPPIVHIPIEVQRAMAQRVQKAALPEGDRALPVAGLIFFQYRGQAKGIHSLELIYNGPAGQTSMRMQP
jgi:hypothetical protein